MKRRNVIRLLRLIIEAARSVQEMRNQRQDHSIIFLKDYLTEDEAAVYMNCTKAYIRRLMKGDGNGPIIPYYQPTSNNCYIARVDLDRFIVRIRHRSADEIRAVSQRKR